MFSSGSSSRTWWASAATKAWNQSCVTSLPKDQSEQRPPVLLTACCKAGLMVLLLVPGPYINVKRQVWATDTLLDAQCVLAVK